VNTANAAAIYLEGDEVLAGASGFGKNRSAVIYPTVMAMINNPPSNFGGAGTGISKNRHPAPMPNANAILTTILSMITCSFLAQNKEAKHLMPRIRDAIRGTGRKQQGL
jgi:hypothetical protein